jgi:hypothetical protein
MKRAKLFGIWLVCFIGAVLILLRMLWCVAFSHDKAREIARAISRTGNAAANGDPKETISSRAHHARSRGREWGCRLCRWLDWLDPNHCQIAAENDQQPRHESRP